MLNSTRHHLHQPDPGLDGKAEDRVEGAACGVRLRSCRIPQSVFSPTMPQGPGQGDRLPIQKHLHRLHETPPVTSPFLLLKHPFLSYPPILSLHAFSSRLKNDLQYEMFLGGFSQQWYELHPLLSPLYLRGQPK